MSGLSTTAFTSAPAERAYIVATAKADNVDPLAELAVAAHEGVTLPAEVGDYDTSFGPNQLHAGGELPASIWAQGATYAQQWANSPAGLAYALAGVARVSAGLTGDAAVSAIVTDFEQPLDPAPEIRNSEATYAQLAAGNTAAGPSTGAPVIQAGGTSTGTSTSSTPTGEPTTQEISWLSDLLNGGSYLGPLDPGNDTPNGSGGGNPIDVFSGLVKPLTDLAKPFTDLATYANDVRTAITSENFWIRVALFGAGAVLLVLGLRFALLPD